MPKLKRQVSVRTTAEAGEWLDRYLVEHPGVGEAEVTAEALKSFIQQKKAQESKGGQNDQARDA